MTEERAAPVVLAAGDRPVSVAAIERFLCETCADLLELDEVAPGDNLFELGFDSLLVMSLGGAAEEIGLPFDVGAVFERQTVAALAGAMALQAAEA